MVSRSLPYPAGESSPAVQEFMTTQQGFRLATSVGGDLTGRGADFIIIDDPLKPDEALSETQRKAARLVRSHALQPPQRQAQWLHHPDHAAPARARPRRPCPWAGTVEVSSPPCHR